MKRTVPALCVASAFAFVVGAAAQQPGSTTSSPTRNDGVTTSADTQVGRPGASDAITLTGCLDRAANGTYELRKAQMGSLASASSSTSPSGNGASTTTANAGSSTTASGASTTGSGSASTTADRAGASTTDRGAASTTGTTASATGTSGVTSAARAPMSDMPMTWTLKSSTDLAAHVGHQVQITGKPTAEASTSGSTSATTTPSTTTAAGARMETQADRAHSVDVQSVRMISSSCQ